jgi:hypothetical protein
LGVWLSHVPSSHFAAFWSLWTVRKPDGRVFFVDNAVHVTGSRGQQIDEERTLRTLADGSEFEIVKCGTSRRRSSATLPSLAGIFRVRVTGNGMFIVGTGARSHSR